MKHSVVVLVQIVLVSLSTAVRAGDTLNLSVLVTGTPGHTYYSAALSPQLTPEDADPTHLQFHHGTIGSGDARYTANTNEYGWALREPVYTDQASFVASLNQPWVMILDNGMPSERHYSMSLDLGNLAAADLTPPVISGPLDGSVLNTLTPSFSFALPAGHGPFLARLYHFVYAVLPGGGLSGTSVIDDQLYLNPAATQWSPSHALLPATDYTFDLWAGNDIIPSAGFTAPTIAASIPPADWSSNVNVEFAAETSFTTPAPEPTTLPAVAAGLVLVVRRRRVRQSRASELVCLL